MVLKSDQERIKALLKDTITLLCRNGLTFKTEFSIEALIGITLDQDDVLLVNINEIVRNELGAKLNAARQQEEAGGNDWSDDYSGEDSGTPSPSNSGGRKRRRKRRRSSGQGSKGDDQESDGGGGDIGSGNSITGADDGSLTEPPNKRSITSRMKDLVKQEQDDDDKDIVFIKEEMDSGDWGSSSQAPDNFPSDLSAIPSSSGTSQQQQENFDFLQGNTLVPMGGSSQQNASMWADMTGRQNIMSPASKRTSAVNPNPGAPMGDESQQETSSTKWSTASDRLRTSLIPHRVTNDRGVLVYQCPVCFRVINTGPGWLCHAALHTGKYRYNCKICDKGFSSTTRLKAHVLKFHPTQSLDDCADIHQCTVCYRTYTNIHHLEQHMQSHNDY